VKDGEISMVCVLSVQQGRVLSADLVWMAGEVFEEFNESDGRKVLPPELAGRLPVEGMQQSGLTVLGKSQWPPGDKKITLTITLSKELQGSGPVPASVNLGQDQYQEVYNLVFKRHAGLKIGHKANYENVPGPVAKAKAPPGPVVKIDSLLLVAARGGNKAAVASLIAQGAAVNARDNQVGLTPLHNAAFGGHKEIAELLIAHGAAVDARDEPGRTPLHCAAAKGHLDIIELLIAKGAKVNAKTDYDFTPLHAAQTKEVAGILLAHGADVNAKTERGYTPLHCSAGGGSLWRSYAPRLSHEAEIKLREVAEVLIAHGADVNAKNDDGLTPLHYAAWHGRLEVVVALIAHGAAVNAKDDKGRTPLHYAVEYGRLEVVDALLAHGAAVNAKDDKGRTPLKYVLLTLQDLRTRPKLAEHYEAIAKLLRQHGAKE
jgi:ankyrin repeat protein